MVMGVQLIQNTMLFDKLTGIFGYLSSVISLANLLYNNVVALTSKVF